jgi:hypothetical protein
MEALIPVATSGGPTMFARIGVMRALNCHVEVRSMVAFVFRLVYRLFCKKYFTVLPKYRRLHDRGRDERSLTPRARGSPPVRVRFAVIADQSRPPHGAPVLLDRAPGFEVHHSSNGKVA